MPTTIKTLLAVLLLFAGASTPNLAMVDFACEEKRIQFLLTEVERSGMTFHRNGESHDSKSAASHLSLKLNNALNSWFSPSKEKWTAEKFIEELASKSSWSGKPYFIQATGEKPQPIRLWLLQKLDQFDPSLCR